MNKEKEALAAEEAFLQWECRVCAVVISLFSWRPHWSQTRPPLKSADEITPTHICQAAVSPPLAQERAVHSDEIKKKKKKEQENEGTATRGSGESPPFFLSTTQSVCSPNPTSTPRIPQTDNSKKSSDLDWRVKPRPNGLKFGANAFHWGIKDKHFERNRGLTDQKQLSGRCGGRHSCDFSDSRRRPVDPQQVLKHFHTCHERLKNCPLNGPGSFALVPQGERLIKGPPLDHRRGAEA